jgi:hypothetical protein
MRERLKQASFSILALCCAALGAAAAVPNDELIQAARITKDRFYKCAQATVAEYDDRISPANVVAKAVAAKCEADASSWGNAMLAYMKREQATSIYNDVMHGEDGNLVAIVLRHRVLNSAPGPAPVRPVADRNALKK